MGDPATGILEGASVVVTGSSRGIGRGIVERCLGAGAKVVGVSRSGGVVGDPERHVEIALDVTDPAASEAALAAALEAFDSVDGLVNNAGVMRQGACWEQTDQDFDESLATNLTAPFLWSQHFARHWVQGATEGAIVNICSLESDIGWKVPPQSVYAISKGGLLGLTRAMALDLAAHQVRVVGIAPGVIDSEMATDVAVTAARIPLGNRLGTAEEIGDATAFLLSNRASYITGEVLYVDGGYKLP